MKFSIITKSLDQTMVFGRWRDHKACRQNPAEAKGMVTASSLIKVVRKRRNKKRRKTVITLKYQEQEHD